MPSLSRNYFLTLSLATGGPRYSRAFYMQIWLFTMSKLVQNANFVVKNEHFIYEFSIRGKNMTERIYRE